MLNYIKKFEQSIKEYWNYPAINDYKREPITYGELAREIEILHILWEKAGLKEGDKISLNSRSCTNWGIAFMAATSGGYVACQLFQGFTPDDTQKLVNHSESKILFTEKGFFDSMNFEEMPELVAAIDMKNMELLAARGEFGGLYARRHEFYNEKYPDGIAPEDIKYPEPQMENLCCLNYTSGSTGNPKGVMLTMRNISSNIEVIPTRCPYTRGEKYLSMLPFAHIYGLTFDLITPLCMGMHLTVLGMLPAPTTLKDAMQAVRPKMAIMVPLVLSKMVDYAIGEFLHSKSGKARLANYKQHPEFCFALRTILLSYFGGNIELMTTGGAAIPEELEHLLSVKLQLPLVTAYGMTECGPLITLGNLATYKLKSCGELVDRIEARIDSANPENTVGELWVKGDNVFAGYYKNPEADKELFTEDGWFRTGDLGTMDKDNTLFLVGRCKSMLLSTNGQNVYPEEIEVKMNALPYITESLMVQRGEKFVALIVPDTELLAAHQVSTETFISVMEKNFETLNSSIPAYAQISSYELRDEAFAKTPKGSIKRFMYS